MAEPIPQLNPNLILYSDTTKCRERTALPVCIAPNLANAVSMMDEAYKEEGASFFKTIEANIHTVQCEGSPVTYLALAPEHQPEHPEMLITSNGYGDVRPRPGSAQALYEYTERVRRQPQEKADKEDLRLRAEADVNSWDASLRAALGFYALGGSTTYVAIFQPAYPSLAKTPGVAKGDYTYFADVVQAVYEDAQTQIRGNTPTQLHLGGVSLGARQMLHAAEKIKSVGSLTLQELVFARSLIHLMGFSQATNDVEPTGVPATGYVTVHTPKAWELATRHGNNFAMVPRQAALMAREFPQLYGLTKYTKVAASIAALALDKNIPITIATAAQSEASHLVPQLLSCMQDNLQFISLRHMEAGGKMAHIVNEERVATAAVSLAGVQYGVARRRS